MKTTREHKFRAWDPEAKMMLDEWVLSQDYSYMIPGETINLNQLVQDYGLQIMPFAGFYDCVGKEVYEGDILVSRQFLEGLDEETFEVCFDRGSYCLSDYPQAESGGNVYYRNWFDQLKQDNLPQPACNFQVVGHCFEPLERIEQRLMKLKDTLSVEEQI